MNVLTQRIGPLPAWVWGGLAAGAIWFFLLRGKASATSGTSAASGTSPNANSVYGLGYAQGLQAAGPQGTAGPGTPSTSRRGHTVKAPPGFPQSGYGAIPIYTSPTGDQIAGWAAFDSDITLTGPSQSGRTPPGQFASNQWFPVDFGGSTGFMNAASFESFSSGGTGGPGRKHAIGARSAASLHSDAHPLIGAPVKYPHYVRAVGGPANHRREIHRIASQSGVHPERIAMLNPVPTGLIRVA